MTDEQISEALADAVRIDPAGQNAQLLIYARYHVRALVVRVRELEVALRPFAECAISHEYAGEYIPIEWFNRAAELLTEKQT